ncbi:sigma-70 family RNA polymerase sigma factor [Variovorax sp. J2P1-59]|uniref:sigma-70 family RNA polymerase sigma factor n=1 Tax=Variovorax flavidus TaxID=3053501 RepID=UPI002577D858|nr:sigma-70 family RNA polymerase sigma factor [Variovorax sp. J2P1-59]MDM0078114.1 sigma-70 family RNA polymerase sigma factor [Variovorax sp. J2P1-59]
MSNGNDWLALRFEAHRGHLRRVAYRVLGSLGEAEDAVQEAWLRLARSECSEIDNLGGWLTTVVSRVCLDMLRSRATRGEQSLDESSAESAAAVALAANPEEEAQLAESVGLALLVVLETLEPAERLAFVLHDMFDLAFEEIAAIVGRTPTTARKLASRARRRVRGAQTADPARIRRHREVVDTFIEALRAGDFEGLVAILDPDMVFRTEAASRADARVEVHGARNWARGAIAYAQAARFMRPALINGAVGLILAARGRLQRVLVFEFDVEGRIRAAEIISDPGRLGRLDLAALPWPT